MAEASRDESLSRYLQAVEAEKQERMEYAMLLRKQYLKMDIVKSVNSKPKRQHLPDEEKDYLMEIQKTLEERIYIRSELDEHKEKIDSYY